VRQRAAKAGQSLAFAPADATLDSVPYERARELAGEYKRWLDLQRTRRELPPKTWLLPKKAAQSPTGNCAAFFGKAAWALCSAIVQQAVSALPQAGLLCSKRPVCGWGWLFLSPAPQAN